MASRPPDAGTNPSALRVVDLRAILYEHGVHVPHHARKAALIELYESHVRPTLEAKPEQPAPRDEPAAKAERAPSEERPRIQTPRTRRIRESLATPRVSSPLARAPIESEAEGFADNNVFQSARKPRRSMLEREMKREEPQASMEHTPPKEDVPITRSLQPTPPKPSPQKNPRKTPPPADCKLPGTTQSHDMHTPQLRARAERLAATASQPPPPAEYRIIDSPDSKELAARISRNLGTSILRALVWLAAIAWLWYCWRTRALGFCPMGAVPENTLWPQCTPCPALAVCIDGVIERCRGTEHVLERPAYTQIPLMKQLLPLQLTAPACVPDTFRLVLAKELSDAVVAMLSHWHGQIVCNKAEPVESAPDGPHGRVALPAATVRAALQQRVDDSIDAELFDSVWDMAIDGLRRHSDALTVIRTSELWFASPRATLPLLCRLRLYVLRLLWQQRVRLMTISALAFSMLVIVRQVRATRARTLRAQECAATVLACLKESAIDERTVPVNHLRDEILHGIPSARARRQLWARVARIVEQNANVRSRQAQVHGQWMRVWEWLGAPGGSSRTQNMAAHASPVPSALSPDPDPAPAPPSAPDTPGSALDAASPLSGFGHYDNPPQSQPS